MCVESQNPRFSGIRSVREGVCTDRSDPKVLPWL
eukprot:IDg2316t1